MVSNTITDLLGITNPKVTLTGKKPSKTEHDDYVRISLDHVRPIQGFTQANIQAMYEDLLFKRLNQTREDKQNIKFLSMRNYADCDAEKGIDRMLLDWFSAVLRPCVAYSATKLLERFGLPQKTLEFKYEPKLYAIREARLSHEAVSPLRPDWAVVDMSQFNSAQTDVTGIANVVGEDKRSQGFDPQLLGNLISVGGTDYENIFRSERSKSRIKYVIATLKQIGTYAWLGQTRYAFVITENTATFLRFFLVQRAQYTKDIVLGAEYSWIDMTNSGTSELTMNRGLYALAMMAQNEQYRNIVEEQELEDLNVWYYEYIEGEYLYFHPISEIVTTGKPDIDRAPIPIAHAKMQIRMRFEVRHFHSINEATSENPWVSDSSEGSREIGSNRSEVSGSDSGAEYWTISKVVPNDRVLNGRLRKRTRRVKQRIKVPRGKHWCLRLADDGTWFPDIDEKH
ncbi:hypothetical protein F5Y10DRAFT_262993 [Nemania abortiva]|nr:hypothetical protein F5Y10DRAFT_262993 [Nemania abortiva]